MYSCIPFMYSIDNCLENISAYKEIPCLPENSQEVTVRAGGHQCVFDVGDESVCTKLSKWCLPEVIHSRSAE